MESSSFRGLTRCSNRPADSEGQTPKPTGKDGPAKRIKPDRETTPVVEEVPEEQKKTKTLMRRVPDDHVKFVLAFKPTTLCSML